MDGKSKIGKNVIKEGGVLIANSIEIPDECPVNCSFKENMLYQGSMCHRCPVFNCKKDEEGFSLLEPEEYRKDFALEWKHFFDTGAFPQLNLIQGRDIR